MASRNKFWRRWRTSLFLDRARSRPGGGHSRDCCGVAPLPATCPGIDGIPRPRFLLKIAPCMGAILLPKTDGDGHKIGHISVVKLCARYENSMQIFLVFYPIELPPWLGGKIHANHRARLLYKMPEFYSRYCWSEKPITANYYPGFGYYENGKRIFTDDKK